MVSDINAGTPEFSSSCMGCAQMFLSMAWISPGWQDYLLTRRCILIYWALVHVHMGVHVCVTARGHPWVSSSITHQLVLERRSLAEPGDHQMSRPAGQQALGSTCLPFLNTNIAHQILHMQAIPPGCYVDAVVLILASQALCQLSHLPASLLFLREIRGGVLSSAKPHYPCAVWELSNHVSLNRVLDPPHYLSASEDATHRWYLQDSSRPQSLEIQITPPIPNISIKPERGLCSEESHSAENFPQTP